MSSKGRIYKEVKRQFSIIILQQSACSPEVNALDLSIWMSIQVAVENRHQNRRKDPNGLAAKVREGWENLPAVTIQKVFH
jgi:hypothetical protein